MIRVLAALLFAVLLGGAAAEAQTFPPLSGRVVDAAKLLSPEQVAQLTQLSAQVEQASSRQLVVATIPDLQGYPIEDYGYQLGRAWKIGQKDANNGILLIVAPKEHKVRIEVGYGLEPLMTDALSGMIVDDVILPKFRAGDIPGGIMAGAQEIAEQLKLPLEAGEARAKARLDQQHAQQQQRARGNDRGGNDWFMAVFWIAVIFFVVIPMIGGGMRRGRRFRGGVAPVILWGPWGSGSGWGGGGGGSRWGGGGGGFGGGGSGFSGGGGSFGGGGASGSW